MPIVRLVILGGNRSTNRYQPVADPDFEMRSSYPFMESAAPLGIAISVTHPSKGGGRTKVWTWMPEGTFLQIAKAMVEASPSAAEQAFLAVLTQGAKARAKRPKGR